MAKTYIVCFLLWAATAAAFVRGTVRIDVRDAQGRPQTADSMPLMWALFVAAIAAAQAKPVPVVVALDAGHGGEQDGAIGACGIREKDVATLQGAPRVGRKKADQLILDLAEKMDDLLPDVARRTLDVGEDRIATDAVRALVSLGYSSVDAERAVKSALDDGGAAAEGAQSAPELIRRALAKVTRHK